MSGVVLSCAAGRAELMMVAMVVIKHVCAGVGHAGAVGLTSVAGCDEASDGTFFNVSNHVHDILHSEMTRSMIALLLSVLVNVGQWQESTNLSAYKHLRLLSGRQGLFNDGLGRQIRIKRSLSAIVRSCSRGLCNPNFCTNGTEVLQDCSASFNACAWPEANDDRHLFGLVTVHR